MQSNTTSSNATRRNRKQSIAYGLLLAKSLVAGAASPALATPSTPVIYDNIACMADLNADETVDGADLAVVLGEWGNTHSDADLTGDGVVNAADLSILLGGWGQSCNRTDLNADGEVDGRDISEFARLWESADISADINRDGSVDADDLARIRRRAGLLDGRQRDIDRRPVKMLRIWNGAYHRNDHGLSPGYDGADGPERIAASLQSSYDEGWRRIWMLLPAGCYQEDAMNGSLESWQLRDAGWKADMERYVGSWIATHPDVTLSIYTGALLRGKVTPTRVQLLENLEPWTRLGVTEFGLDATSPDSHQVTYYRAVSVLKELGGRAVMEAIPVDDDRQPQYSILDSQPGFALKRFINNKDPEGRWAFNPDSHEIFAEVGRGRSVERDEIIDLLARGFIPVVYSINAIERRSVLETVAWFEDVSIDMEQE